MNKKNIFLFLLMALPTLLLTSCLKDQEDVFPEPSSIRMKNYLADAANVLKSSENGWVLNYYPDREQSYGSFIYTIKFDGERAAVACPQLTRNAYVTDTCTYRLVSDDGPILTFDTYSDIMHFFATPTGSSGAGGYQAYDGDFEFIILGISDDQSTITLKGKRSGNVMTMNKLTYDAEEYIANADSINTHVAEELNVLQLVVDGKKAKFFYGDDYTITYTNDEGETETITTPFVCTDKDVVFYQPIEVYGLTIKGFTYVANATEYPVLSDTPAVLTASTDAVDQLVAGLWFIAYSNLSPKAQEGWKAFATACAGDGEELVYAFIGTYDGAFGFGFQSGDYAGMEYMTYETEGADVITLAYGGTGDRNGLYYRSYLSLGKATAPFYSTFKLTKDDEANPTYMILTDTEAPENVIKLVAEYVSNPTNK